MRHWELHQWMLVLVSLGAVSFNDLRVEEQQRVFDHCNSEVRISRIVAVCDGDLFPSKCWMPHFKMCLDTWR